jgi:hypothetical protein
MSDNKHISLNSLQIFLRPLIRIINRKAESWEDLKDKPFKEENKAVTIVDTEFELFDGYEDGVPSNNLTFNSNLEEGKEYNIIYDGITYSCKLKYVSEYDMYYIGNAAIADESYGFPVNVDTGEPFFIWEAGYNVYQIIGREMNSNHSIFISTKESVVTKKLDSKFIELPKGILTKDNYLETTTG